MKHALQTKITGKGQTAIPVAVQQAIGATPGNCLRWELKPNGVCEISVVSRTEEKGAKAMLGFAKTFREARPTEEWVKNLGGSL